MSGFLFSSVLTPALADPAGGQVVGGAGTISGGPGNTIINQGSDRLIIEWDSFDTSAGESVRFNQPGSASWALNRVISNSATNFDGSLFANGNVAIVNRHGIHFGPNAHVDVGGLIASTADITNRNFMNGRMIFDIPGVDDAMVTNAGTISVRDTGLAALVAPGVENTGLIRANLGTVILGAGETHTIDFNGDGLVSFAITSPTKKKPRRRDGSTAEALVSNKGTLQADGGSVIVTARQASKILDNTINMAGITRANSVGTRNGKIVLFGGGTGSKVKVSGRVKARGRTKGSRGGTVHVSANTVETSQATFELDGDGGGGTLLIGGAYKGGKLADNSPIGYLRDGDLVSILTGDGAGAAGNGYFPNADVTLIDQGTLIDASATGTSEGGSVFLWGTESIGFHGTVNTLGGANGFVEVSTKGTGTIDGVAETGHMLVDPGDVCVTSAGGTNNCAAGATLLADSTVLAVLNTGSVFELNTDALGTSGTGRVDFGGGIPFTVSNNSGTIGTFRIIAADDINTRQVVLSNNGSTGTNYEFFAGSSATAAPQSTADVILFGQDLVTGGGHVIFDAADDILIRDPIQSGGGDVTLIARGGNAGATVFFQTSDAAIITTDGAGNAGTVSITTDNVDIAATAVASPLIDANGTGGVISFAPTTAGRTIDLGTDNAASLSFTDAELNRFSAPILRIGSATSGDITVSAPISPTSAAALELVSGGAIDVNNSITTGNGDVSLTADTMAIAAAVNAGTGTITMAPLTANLPINLGTEVAGSLSLTDAELDFLTASTVRVGSTASGDISVSAPVSPATTSTFELVTGGAVVDNTPTEQSDLIATNVTINAGTGIGTAANDIDVASALLTLTNTTSGDVNVFNTGAVTVTGASVVSSFAAVGTIFNVDNAATVNSSGTIAVDALTGNLDGNLTATSGITGNLSTINVLGSTGGAEIQDAVDLAATGATVNVAAGSYAGFVVDVANLSVLGSGPTTIINPLTALPLFPAVTIAANGVTIAGMQLQGVGGVANTIGILLDGIASPDLTGVVINDVVFDGGLDDGIRSQGDIGDGVASTVDVTITGNSAADPTRFQNLLLGSAIDVGDTDGDAIYSVSNVVVESTNGTGLTTLGPGFLFGAVGGVTVQDVSISNPFGSGIEFAAQTGATIDISNTTISGQTDGIEFQGLTGGTVGLGGTNQITVPGQAIRVSSLLSGNVFSVTGGTYDGTNGALLVNNTLFGPVNLPAAQIVIGAAAFVGGTGSSVAEISTISGRPVIIDFAGSATFDGGINGLILSGPDIDVRSNTFGTIAFGSTTPQTGNIIQLANGAEFLPGRPTTLNATDVSFNGILGSDLTSDQVFALENQLVHFPDDNSLGLINTNSLVVVKGESIQLAVNAAGRLGGPQTVTVGEGTFGGSVEVWPDNLLLVGQGSTTIIDTDAVDRFANNGDVDNGFIVVAASEIAGFGDVTGVTIEGFTFDTLSTTGSNIGVELGKSGTSVAIGTTIQRNTFNDLQFGISRNSSAATTTISSNDMTAIASIGIFIGNDPIDGETFRVIGNNVASLEQSLAFGPAVMNSEIVAEGNTFVSGNNAAIDFMGGVINSAVRIGGPGAIAANDLTGGTAGINANGVTGGTVAIDNNTISGGVGIALDEVSGAGIVVSNTIVDGTNSGVNINGSTRNNTANRAVFQNAALRGTIGPGLRITTRSGGAGMHTSFAGGNVFTGAPAMLLSGPGQSLEGDTLADTNFVAVGGAKFIELADGGLFEPGRPTLIDGTFASFNNVPVLPDLDPAVIAALEKRIIDFDDDQTLGQIFFRSGTVANVVVTGAVPIDLTAILNEFFGIIDDGITTTNIQAPGDPILRPIFPFLSPFGNPMDEPWPLGTCLVSETGDVIVVGFACIAPAEGSDISPFVADYMADVTPFGAQN